MLLNQPYINYQQSFMPYINPWMSQYYNLFGGGPTNIPNMGQYFQGQGVPNTGLLSSTPSWFDWTPVEQKPFDPNFVIRSGE